MRATGDEKRVLGDQIAQKRQHLRRTLNATAPPDAVDWRIEFAEVLDTAGGFDVVIANPPYIRMELFKEQKPILRKNFPLVHSERADLYCYFYGRALKLLRHGGILAFISSSKWLRAAYGANLRKHLAEVTEVREIIDFGDLPVFEGASSYPMILIAKKGDGAYAPRYTRVNSLADPYPDMLAVVAGSGKPLPLSAVNGSNWMLVEAVQAGMFRRTPSGSVPLAEYVRGEIFYGVKTGLNAAFMITSSKRGELIAEDPSSDEVIRPLVVGRDVREWSINYGDRWLIYMHHGIDPGKYPALIRHLAHYRPRLEQRATNQRWYQLQQPQFRYSPAFDQKKIIYPIIAKGSRFAFDIRSVVINDKCFAIPTQDLYLLGVLNSATAWAFFESTCSRLRGGWLELRLTHVSQLPVPTATDGDRAAIATLVEACIAAVTGGRQADLEAEIDERVAWLYGLPAGTASATSEAAGALL